MYWPRFRLTKSEAKRWAIYSNPTQSQKQVLYRIYAGEIALSTTNREDTENMQISRRARVFAFTCSGDVNNVEVSIYDSAGEQYTMGFVPAALLVLGDVPDFRGVSYLNGLRASLPGAGLATSYGFPSTGQISGMRSQAPHIFEPNIVLDPNQTLSIKGRSMLSLTDVAPGDGTNPRPGTATLAFNIHVWEFPLE